MMERQDGVFLVCVEQEEGNDGDPVVVGSLRLEWELRGGAADSEKEEEEELVGHIGAVSVPPRYASRGIGKGLVKAAEEFLVAEVQRQGRPKAPVVMELGVINLRKELFPWYEAMGYSTGKPLPHSEELERIILPGVEVFCIGMSKRLR
jgi:ribosomal protein S18 acetylase RimI-like enzyme